MNCAKYLVGDSISRSESHRNRSLVLQYELVDKDRSEPRQLLRFGGRSESLGTWIARLSFQPKIPG
jgi:hypothetical protein